MRKWYYSVLLIVIVSANSLMAQPVIFKPFKVDTGLEFNFSTDNEVGSGLGFYISPIYNATDRLSIGPRFGFGYTGSGSINVGVGNVEIGTTYIFSFLYACRFFLLGLICYVGLDSD